MTSRTTSRRTTDFDPRRLATGWIFHLLADGDPMAVTDQSLQITVGGMDRHAAHRDVFALVASAFGKRDAECGCRDFGIGEEHLVEIAHPVEQQIARIERLDLVILLHHRRGTLVARRKPFLDRPHLVHGACLAHLRAKCSGFAKAARQRA